ncbi:MAG: leucine-rich repeat protein [Bacteroidota bacterium]
MKKISSTIILLCITITCFAQTFTDNGFNFNVLSTNPNEVEVTGGSDGSSPLTIPGTATDGSGIVYTVTTIGNSAYRNGANNGVILPNTITTISFRAFRDNGGLTTVTLPASVTNISGEAFLGGGLNEIIALGTTPASIGNSSFGTRSTIDLIVPDGLEETYRQAGWTGFNTVNGEIAVGSTFEVGNYRYRVTSQNPAEVEVAGRLNGIVDLVFPTTVVEPQFGGTYTVTAVGNRAFRNAGINSVVFSNTIATIKNEAFELNNLTTVTLPAAVTTIDNEAFRDNPLTEVISQAVAPPTLGTNSIGNRGDINLTIPNGSETAYTNGGWTSFFSVNGTPIIGADFSVDGFNYRINGINPNTVEIRSGGNGIADLVLPSSITKNNISFAVNAIGNRAFRNRAINSVVLPTSTEVIGDEAFELNDLTSVTIPASVNTIGSRAFLNNDLTQVTFNAGPETIGNLAFRDNLLSSITIPNGTVTIGEGAFFENQLTSVTIPASVDVIDREAFMNNQLSSVNIPTGVITIGRAAFQSNVLTNVTIGNTVETIDVNAFFDNQLTSITLPSALTTLGSAAFRNNQLTSIVIPDGVTEIRPQTFRENNLATVTLPANLQFIRNDAFRNNEITSINFPASLTELGGFSFRGNQLTSVTIPTTISVIGVNTFSDNQLTDITIPSNITAIQNDAFAGNPLQTITADNATPATITSSSFGARGTINVFVIPDQQSVIDDYIAAGWTGFGSINGQFQVGAQFTVGDLRYEVTDADQNIVKVISRATSSQNINIPTIVTETLSSESFDVTAIEDNAFQNTDITAVTIGNTIETIGNNAFQNTNITTVIIPTSVTSIGTNAFVSPTLTQVEAVSTTPATIATNSFGDRESIALTVPTGTETTYENAGWTGFFSVNGNGVAVGNTFTENGIRYEILSLSPNTVSAVGRNGSVPNGDYIFPEVLSKNGLDFTITTIGNEAFRNAGVRSVSLPSTLTTIRFRAFRSNNNLTTVTIPASVTSISIEAFSDGGLREVIAEGTVPASINANGSFGTKTNVDIFIPQGTTQAYVDAGWIGFKSLIEQGTTILEPKAYLQGAFLNPNAGEEDLMRDDLRVAGLIPTTSPFVDALTCNSAVFNRTGNDAIVDWVFVELRDAADNTTVVEGRSALLQRDGDIVDVNGLGILKFNAAAANYFVTIQHRNHLGIITVSAVSLLGDRVTVDFTNATNPITFGSNAQTTLGMPADTSGMWAGNANEDTIVQYSGTNPDAPVILSLVLNDPGNFLNFSTFAVNGYNVNDLDLDGRIQYEGIAPDAPFILQNVLAHPGNFLNFSTFQIIEQLP